ncbi:cation:proton antiporter [Geomesophilobacter sediminis]|uniref:Sodium:proton antiporter n=1 Tax=Geomesophilobacter sediminis TaxID=2798584 RepID=A0A8J7JML3_9BACT|nr:sodium:proton antiporter [Geomesophilobacter sediminis]MBJ6726090.1 sodium:proton antiporter [Geomesophilobacter sediminis]
MRTFHIIGILTSLAALFSYLNYRFLKLPTMIGLMLQSLAFSLLLMGLSYLGVDIVQPVQKIFERINFNVLFLEGLLSFLLFAGALFVKVEELLDVKFDIAILSVAGVVVSAGMIGGALYGISELLGLQLRPVFCFLFGALISPTDPVATLPILRRLGVSARVNAMIAGESLFNDGVGIVLFLSLMVLTQDTGPVSVGEVAALFCREAVGGAFYGALLGWVGYLLIKSVDNFRLEILITLALVSGGYSLATVLHVSGPLAMVVAGLLIGGRGRKLGMSERTRRNLDLFWDLVEDLLNAILFTLIGLEVLVISRSLTVIHLLTALVAVPLVIVARYLSVVLLGSLLHLRRGISLRTAFIMTWGGLRGGIPVALALTIPEGRERTVFLFATYVVVVFSILVQGFTLKHVVGKQVGE